MGEYEDALRQMRDDAITSARSRLQRPLSELELAGLHAISSCLMMESIGNGFAFAGYSVEQIEADLRYFSEQAATAADQGQPESQAGN